MQHYYLGVEHLFIALLSFTGSIASEVLEIQGMTAQYVIDAVRRKVGKGEVQVRVPGMPTTPRADVILGIASDLALGDNRREANDRDVLTAILEENESIPVRVLRSLGLDTNRLLSDIQTATTSLSGPTSFIRIDFSPDFDRTEMLTEEQLFILRQMFRNYAELQINYRLTGGHTGAVILAVTPVHSDQRRDAAVVVKIDQADNILKEAENYEAYVKSSLPPLTARLEDRPVAPDTSNLAGLKYTLVINPDEVPQDLRGVVRQFGAESLSQILRQNLYQTFGRLWWQQKQAYRFPVWSEYDYLLPPLLTLESIPDYDLPEDSYVIRHEVKRNRLKRIELGDIVIIENFVVQRVYQERGAVQLALGRGAGASRRAYRIEIRKLDMRDSAFYRDEIVPRMVGRVWKTRSEVLEHAVLALDPEFDIRALSFHAANWLEKQLPNPLLAYEDLLERHVNGSLSKLHGDLHLGNILVGPNFTTWLIDFAHTHDGHTLFDWACLETSLLSEIVLNTIGESWEAARMALRYVYAVNTRTAAPRANPLLSTAMSPIYVIREIVEDLLESGDWAEYHIALVFCALRALTWSESMPAGARRLMFLVAALSLAELENKHRRSSSLDTPPVDASDITEGGDE